ncbi:TATA-binding protein-associated factor BTAF1 [Camellia lanceoleosa]|uniref:TATA-binding protein-associated factor BTAF1 n=1 Tax=Camellia lanceoleosa TaxID=1840588 RepID=A0ACC0FJE6_9ERIC|nr:TATA-binding protein-associated factor BTAF1 [Camellia lanceoleosa]
MDPCETPQAAVLSSERLLRIKISSPWEQYRKQKSKVHMLASGEDRSRVEGFISRRVLKPGSLEGLTSKMKRILLKSSNPL